MRQLLFSYIFLLLTDTAFAQQPITCHNRNHYSPISSERLMAGNERSDTIDILNYTIHLNITDFANQTIRGNTSVKFVPLMNNVLTLPLDLLKLSVDSVTDQFGSSLAYTYNDTLLQITLTAPVSIGDTSSVIVWYNGKPQIDGSGWGGFYFQSGYAFNLGVGFDADPHVYGRVWFPCFDNFVERSTYRFEIETDNGRLAYCNGTLIDDTTDPTGLRTRTWEMLSPIPTYLASVTVAPYAEINQIHQGINGAIPILLAALPADTTNMKNSFVNLGAAIDAYEDWYFPYNWNRVGYCLVPFNSGAMEHATNITYPRFAANGTLAFESELMGHELSHHWWGNLATCRTAEDMWLNEGWATWSGFLMREWLYGYSDYQNSVRNNHDDVIHFAHLRENGYLAVSGVPHQYTYGDHVYLKGADMVHSLRGYMGDSLFRLGINYHLQQSQFKDVGSGDLRDNLIAATGLPYLNDFFNDWIFNPGFPHFSIDSVVTAPNGPNTNATVYIKQKLRGAPNYYTNVPLEITFFGANNEQFNQRMFVSGATTNQTFSIPFVPVYSAVDYSNKLSDAVSDESKLISTTGAHNFTLGRVNLTVNAISDTALIHITHHWCAPDPASASSGYRMGNGRYFSIGGIWPTGFNADAQIYFDGRTTSLSGPSGWFDNDLMPVNADSLILLYRRSAADNWQEFPRYTKTRIGSPVNYKYGFLSIDSILPGDYAFANGVSTVLIGIQEMPAQQVVMQLSIYPNPASDLVNLRWEQSLHKGELIVTDALGKEVIRQPITSQQHALSIAKLSPGFYDMRILENGKTIAQGRLIRE